MHPKMDMVADYCPLTIATNPDNPSPCIDPEHLGVCHCCPCLSLAEINNTLKALTYIQMRPNQNYVPFTALQEMGFECEDFMRDAISWRKG